MLAKVYWGQGLGTEAAQALIQYGFAHLDVSRLICLIDPENQTSERVAKKIGMRFEKEVEDDKGLSLLYATYRHGETDQ